MIVELYPHYIYAQIPEESQRNEAGQWVQNPEPRYKYAGTGRLELSGEGNEQTTADGRKIQRNGTFYSQFCNSIQRGDKVIITAEKLSETADFAVLSDFENVKFIGYVKNADVTQLHTKIYVYDSN